ncbi:protein FAM161B isoform X1 [Cricetulus griseus]|uniref:Protein FAM161B n=1 Tax=Cricetulus griseus TaxID=10029 RepID=G3HNH6_CRIGR|nr:protein FAM161B isoform X1 [Cricetulus griseus]XP_027274291.1 protein FAM161B isoform X1 [Cricetulus griseus]EGW01645.1 Protein FAM161B [Cricetulus griseus]
MTVGMSAGAPECAEWSREIFPCKSSSDTETEDEQPRKGLVLPRAGKLREFLSSEEETDYTSDSTGSFYRTLQVQKQNGRWYLESPFQSDPDSDQNSSEDEEDLESFFQDKRRGKPQVQDPPSLRFGSMRRCSSMTSLPSDNPKVQIPPTSKSGPPFKHRSVCFCPSSITVPQPFLMTLREAEKKAQWLASPASFEQELLQAQKQGQEEAECFRQFRAQPVPAHVYLPLYQEIVERKEAQRRAGIQKRKEQLLSSMKPFSFLENKDQQKEAAPQTDSAAVAQAKVPPKKNTRRIPKAILEPALGDKLQEAELLRKIRIHIRAINMLQMASSPISTSSSRAPRTATRTREEKLSFLQTEFEFRPRVNPVVPDYEGLYQAFQKRAAKRRETRETTRNKPFLLRTANLCHTPRPCDATTAEEGRMKTQKSPQPAATPLPRRHSLSAVASFSANTLPVHITDATRKRESAVRMSLEKKDKSDSIQWLEMHKKNRQAMSKSVILRAKAMDPHKSLEEVFKAKLKENRNNDRKRTKEYKKELEEMKRRIQTRPYLFEQVTKVLARKEAEAHYRDTLRQAGLEEEFVKTKSQGTQAVQNKEKGKVKDSPR